MRGPDVNHQGWRIGIRLAVHFELGFARRRQQDPWVFGGACAFNVRFSHVREPTS